LVIIAGAMDEARNMAGFSNQAGTGAGANWYLTALGARVRTIDETGTGYLYSGTSFSAPVISGAAALLAGAFPNLTGAQIVDLLLKTADDAGAPGTDSAYGRGILNIQRAFTPQGATSMAGTGQPVPGNDGGNASGPMGDARSLAPQMAGAIILDGYSRAFVMDFTTRLSRAPQERPLGQSLAATSARQPSRQARARCRSRSTASAAARPGSGSPSWAWVTRTGARPGSFRA
jgi:hypothetical protein